MEIREEVIKEMIEWERKLTENNNNVYVSTGVLLGQAIDLTLKKVEHKHKISLQCARDSRDEKFNEFVKRLKEFTKTVKNNYYDYRDMLNKIDHLVNELK